MADSEIAAYIRQCRGKFEDEEIRAELRKAGCSEDDITAGFAEVDRVSGAAEAPLEAPAFSSQAPAGPPTPAEGPKPLKPWSVRARIVAGLLLGACSLAVLFYAHQRGAKPSGSGGKEGHHGIIARASPAAQTGV